MSKYDPKATPSPPAKDARPACIRNLSGIEPEAYERPGGGIAGLSWDLGEAVGTRLIGVDVTEVPPGKNSSYLHHHSLKEEFFYVLSGRCRLRLGEESWELGPGDAVSRPAGTGVPHQFQNPYAEPCQVMMLGVMAGRGLEDAVDWPEIGRRLAIDSEGQRKVLRVTQA